MMNEASAPDFPSRWQETLNDMQSEWTRLHQEIAQLRTERNQLAKALMAILREEVTLSEADILAQMGQEKPLRELLQELRTELVEN
jgi:hypothetical protein